MPDAVAFRTDCRSKAEEKPIRAAKCCFEPRGTRLPDARISKPHPRKGTETSPAMYGSYGDIPFQNHIPARGRKPTALLLMIFFMNFKTTSPQGDGNLLTGALRRLEQVFQNHIPARGRKPKNCNQRTFLKVFQNHIPARGRKLLFLRMEQERRRGISKPHPRKGTETCG